MKPCLPSPRTLLTAAVLLATTLLHADPTLPGQDLFGPHGPYVTCRIPGLVVTGKGSILAYCEARQGLKGDWNPEDFLYRRSTDGGRTFSPERVLVRLPEPQPVNPLRYDLRADQGDAQVHARTYQNLIMIPDRDTGSIHVLFEVDYWRCFYMRSDDDGATFSTPREITDVVAGYRQKGMAWRAFGNGCGHGIQLDNGRLVEPLWLTDSSQPHGGGHRPGNVGTIYSDDHGATWQIGDMVARYGPVLVNPSETCAVQLADGRVLFNIRSEGKIHERATVTSPNGATDWTAPHFDPALYEPGCEASLLRVSRMPQKSKNRILFSNPASHKIAEEPGHTAYAGGTGQRSNLTVFLSYDECQTWPVSRVIDPAMSAYSDLAMTSDGTIFCLYERGSRNGSKFSTAALTLVHFDLAWLSGGKDDGR